ncbi:MAG: hypothetical protein EAZ46_06325 [Runella sp.]|nr:MAG: hypothetical protein EAZ46_06325 [Runella sp.]
MATHSLLIYGQITLCKQIGMINDKVYKDNDALEEIIFQFKSLEKSAMVLTSALAHEKAAHNELKGRFETVQQQKIAQVEDLNTARSKVKELEGRVKQLEKNELSLKEKLKNFKQFNNIVKNPRNAEATAELKTKLDDYIRYVDEAIKVLHDL